MMARRRPRFGSETEARARLPVVLLTGFLGSGKTTLVNALLADPLMAGTAVAVNEFGPVPLDRDLIDHGQDRTVVLGNGCLCCNLAGDLEDAIMRVFSRREAGEVPRFARLVIEPSGLADPAPIAQAILRNPVLSRVLRLDAIIATVDAVFAAEQLIRHEETRRQVALADTLVLTKSDLVNGGVDGAAVGALRAMLLGHNPVAPLLVARHGVVDAAALLPASFLDPGAPAVPRAGWLAEAVAEPPAHGRTTTAIVLEADAPLPWDAFEAWLRGVRLGHAERLLRVKGMLDVAGAAGPVVVHGIHHVLHPPTELAAWPGVRRSRLVLIGQGLPDAALRESWAAAFQTHCG